MTEYEFVSIPIVRRRAGHNVQEDYQQVIRERARSGWTFVQALQFETHETPRIDLIFSREGK